MSPSSSAAVFESLAVAHPDIMKDLPMLRFIEQYNPDDTSHGALSQPYVYVADKVEEQDLSVSVGEVQAQGIPTSTWDALMELRDKLAPGEKIGWWAVYCGGPERTVVGGDVNGTEEVVGRMEEQKLGGQVEEVSLSLKWDRKDRFADAGCTSSQRSPRGLCARCSARVDTLHTQIMAKNRCWLKAFIAT